MSAIEQMRARRRDRQKVLREKNNAMRDLWRLVLIAPWVAGNNETTGDDQNER